MALKRLLVAYESVLPGIKYIAVQDYRLVNEAPIEASRAIALADERQRPRRASGGRRHEPARGRDDVDGRRVRSQRRA
jgi:hypothetical protein